MTVQEQIESLKNEVSAAEEDDAARRTKLEAIREKIKSGETTGDRLRDFALVCHGDDLKGTVTKIFRDLEAQLAGKNGQLFAIIEYEDARPHLQMFPHRHPEFLTLGLLDSEQLVLDMQAGTWRIPCREYVRVSGQRVGIGRRHEGPAFFESDNSMWDYLFEKYGQPGSGSPPKIVVGDDNVLAEIPRLDLMKMTLGLTPPAGHWIYAGRDEYRDSAFNKALAAEARIRELRTLLEDYRTDLPFDLKQIAMEIRESIRELNHRLEFSIQLGIDPMRTEVLRMREEFGRYWKVD